jgi:hypothetical protein
MERPPVEATRVRAHGPEEERGPDLKGARCRSNDVCPNAASTILFGLQ